MKQPQGGGSFYDGPRIWIGTNFFLKIMLKEHFSSLTKSHIATAMESLYAILSFMHYGA